jgi:hypothetical protein
MYLRITQRHNREGSTVSYYALAESVWNPDAKRREANVVNSFGRADQLDRAELERLVKSINRVLDGNPQEAERERTRRAQLLVELNAELALLEQHQEDHPKAACGLMASRRYSRYLSEDSRGRPQLDTAKVKAAEKFDGKFVVIKQRRHVVSRGHRAWLQRRVDHRILLPADEADGSESEADVSLDAASDRGARQALCVGAADATGG